MSWGRDDGFRAIVRGLSGLLLATTLLLGGCGHEEDAPELPVEEAAVESDSAREAGTTREPTEAARIALGRIPFEPQGDFPHGEHRRIECRSCHDRPPGHASHASVSCTDCHGVPREYATLPIRSRAECMSCHHDPDRTGECSRCHASAPRQTLPVQTTLRMSVWPGERTREVSFEHRIHGELECGECHGDPPENAVIRECAGCHREHHSPEARCSRCHEPVAGDHHAREVHLGCGGGGCHQDPAVLALPANRPFCLVCHQEQTEHQEGQTCTACHFVAGVDSSGTPSSGGRP